MHLSRFLPALVALVLLVMFTRGAQAEERKRTLSVNGTAREYTLVRPERVTRSLPLLIVYHGGGQTAERARGYTRFDVVAVSRDFIVVYPQGLSNNWNDGRKSADLLERAASTTNDVEFTEQIIAQLAAEGLVNRHRVFLTGASNGGMMSMYAGCRLAGRIAGIAPVVANLPVDWTCESSGLPALFIHGTDDTFMPYTGGRIAERAQRRDLGSVLGTEATIEAFRAMNGCAGVKESKRLDAFTGDRTVAVMTVFDCTRAPLKRFLIEGGGHTWPGARTGMIADWVLGATSREINATNEILTFFESLR
jgi:polyhydroxybutyrate depolymerase